SFDATETTATTASQFHANYNTPCADFTAAGLMTSAACPDNGSPPAPAGSSAVPSADITSSTAQTCGGSGSSGAVSHGTFTQAPGAFKLFGPSGSSVGTIAYLTQNVGSGTGACSTTVRIAFSIGGSSSQTVVL